MYLLKRYKTIVERMFFMELKNNNSGNLIISEEVVSKIACVAAKDVDGVADVVAKAPGIRSMLKTKQVVLPVHVTVRDNQLVIDINVKIKEGVRLADVAVKIQQAVKEAVQNMTGNGVSKVNVHICEVELNRPQDEE